MCSDCTSPTPEAVTGLEPDLVEILEGAASDYLHLAAPMGPIVPDERNCVEKANILLAAARRIREEYGYQESLAASGNTYAECVLQVLDRIVGGT